MIDKSIFKNISSLFSIRIAGYLIPLITIPYLVKTLGTEGFGLMGFTLALLQYCIIAVNYGFDLNATKKVAENSSDSQVVSTIFWNVITAKVLICIFCAMLLCFLSLMITEVNDVQTLLASGYVSVIGAALFPQWLFQGKEQLGTVSLFRVFFQFTNIPLIFIFVNSESDLEVALFLYGLPSLAIALFSFYLIFKRQYVIYISPTLKEVKNEMYDGWQLFLSTFASSLYLNTIPVILGFVSGPTSVAIYVAADKLYRAAQGLYTAVTGAFFPRINSLYGRSKTDAIVAINFVLRIQLLIGIIVSLFLFSYSSFLVELLFGSEFLNSVGVLKILSILPPIIGVASVLAIQTLIVFGYKKEVSKVYFLGGILSLFISIPLSYSHDYLGAAVSVVIVELLITLKFYMLVRHRGINVFNPAKNKV